MTKRRRGSILQRENLIRNTSFALALLAFVAPSQALASDFSVPDFSEIESPAPRGGTLSCWGDPTEANCCSPGQTTVTGTAFGDIIGWFPGGSESCVLALDGSDIVQVNFDGDFVEAGPGNDIIDVDASDVTVFAGPGHDDLIGYEGRITANMGLGDDIVIASDDDDYIAGGGGDDTLTTDDGNDFVLGEGGDDDILAGSGDDVVSAGAGDDIVGGGHGHDRLYAGSGHDVVLGDGGDDTLVGGPGDDLLTGGSGDDILVGGPGDDTVNAGSGDDIVIVRNVCELEAGELLLGGSGFDTLVIPVDQAQLAAFGVIVLGFEDVIVTDELLHESECGGCDCDLSGGSRSCCNGEGTCDAVAGDGALQCSCTPGFFGPSCRTEAAAAPTPPLSHTIACEEHDPVCLSETASKGFPISFVLGDPFGGTVEDNECNLYPAAVNFAFGLEEDEQIDTPGKYQGKVYLPTDDNGAPLAGDYPLLLFVHGNRQYYDTYDDWMEHIASNGIAVVSVENGKENSVINRAQLQLCALRLIRKNQLEVTPELQNYTLAQNLDFDRLILGGHSRGGNATVVAANLLRKLVLDAVELPATVRSVIALAPANKCADLLVSGNINSVCGSLVAYGDQLVPTTPFLGGQEGLDDGEVSEIILGFGSQLEFDAARSFLAVQGSRDDDVDGQGLQLYDLVGTETPTDPSYLRKAMVWVYDVEHNRFGGHYEDPSFGLTRGHTIARAYIGGFARWHTLADEFMGQYFRTQDQPACLADPGLCDLDQFNPPEVFTQFSEGTLDLGGRLVVHDFETAAGGISDNGKLQFSQSALRTWDWANGLSTGSDMRTDGLLVEWDQGGFGVVTMEFPLLDVTDYDYISLRIARDNHAEPPGCLPVNPGPLPARVILGSEGQGGIVTTKMISVLEYAEIMSPDIENDACSARRYFQTVRIPLPLFEAGAVDLESIVRIGVQFDPGLDLERAAIDSVEFVRDPDLCGNGKIDPNELCDDQDLGGETCETLGQGGGDLACHGDCTFDTSDCATCGNGITEGNEECDDGNFDDEDECKSDCTLNVCGDGFLFVELEECDDGNQDDNDDCSNDCERNCSVFDTGEVFCPCSFQDTCNEAFLSCKFRDEDSNEKECLPCDLAGGIGRGCPCNNPGASCVPDEFDENNEDCWKHPAEQWTCMDAVPGWGQHGIPRCWDFNPDFIELGNCQYGGGQNTCIDLTPAQTCVGNLCEDEECGVNNGLPIGICRAANLVCNEQISECEPQENGQCKWPTTIDGSPPQSCTHGFAWCPEP